jgi:RND family efflux transporter MFP subunit
MEETEAVSHGKRSCLSSKCISEDLGIDMASSRRFARFDFAGGIGTLSTVLTFALSPMASMAQEFTAPSIVRAEAEATLSSIISGTIQALPFEKGAEFSAGEELASLDCSIYLSESVATRAEQEAAMIAANSLQALFARGGIGQLEVDVAKAEAAAVSARAQIAQSRADACHILAPYDGRVAEHSVSAFEFVDPGQAVLSIVSTGVPDLEIIAPADWLAWVKPGVKGRLRLEGKEGELSVTIDMLGPVVDPVSRTVSMTAVFDGKVEGILPGMSGIITLEPIQ